MPFCIPRLSGVPGLAAPPKWWTDDPAHPRRYDGASRPTRTEIGDPRWAGVTNQGFGLGTEEEVTFRAGYHDVGAQRSLFLSWHVKYDGQPYSSTGIADKLWVGIEPAAGGGNPFILIFELPHDAPDKVATDDYLVEFRPLSFAAGSPVGAVPDWVNLYTRVWRQVIVVSPFKQIWAFQMLLPVEPLATAETDNRGVKLNPSFRMCYTFDISTPTRATRPGDPTVPTTGGLLRVSWPAASEPSYNAGTNTITVPGPTNWETYDTSAATCPTTTGVSIEMGNIGTMNADSHLMEFSPAGPNTRVNTFYARPTNNSGANIPARQVKAVFRIANWGSDVTPPNNWPEIPHAGQIENQGVIPSDTTATAAQQAQFNWTVGSPFLERLRNAAPPYGLSPVNPAQPWMQWHQCIFVQLSGAGLVFSKDSVYRNMDFRPASLIEQGATLKTLAGQRDIYMMLEKINMPVNTPAGYNEGRFLETTINRVIQEQGNEGALVDKLRHMQARLQQPPPPRKSLGDITGPLQQYLSTLKYRDESGLAKLAGLMRALEAWLTALRSTDAAQRVVTVLNAYASWLESPDLIENGKRLIQFVEAVSAWLGNLQADPATQEFGPAVVNALHAWLETLEDQNGAFGSLGAVLATVQAWLESGQSAQQLPAVLDALRRWFTAMTGGDKSAAAVTGRFAQETATWLGGEAERLGQMEDAAAEVGLTQEEMDQVFPTMRVHVYYDTGRRWKENGQVFPILALQPSFGFRAYHEGALEGWQTVVDGATRVSDNLWVLESNPDGIATVVTKIQAVSPGEERLPEQPITGRPDDNCGCLCQILRLFGIGKK